jgi:hypothetical protein
MLPTLDESGMAVRQNGGQDPHRGIRISDVPAGGPQAASVAPSIPATAPRPLDKGKGATSSSSAPGGTRGSEEDRQRRPRCADGSFTSDPPEASEHCWWGREDRIPGPGRAEVRQYSATTTIRSAATTTTTIGPATATIT